MRDETILRMLRSHDPRGMELLMDRYCNYLSVIVWNILRSRCGPQDAEEIVSDVFLAAWNQADEIRSDCLKSWLATVARRKAIDNLRRIQVELPLEEDVLELPDERNPVTALEKKEEQELVRKAVNQLGEPDREIFVRHYYYIQSVSEISQTLRMKESTVKTKLRRGRMRLKTILTRWGVA